MREVPNGGPAGTTGAAATEPSPGELWAGPGSLRRTPGCLMPAAGPGASESCVGEAVRVQAVRRARCAGRARRTLEAEERGAAGQAHSAPLVPEGPWLWPQVGGRQWAWRAAEGAQAAPGGSGRGGQTRGVGGRPGPLLCCLNFERRREQKTRVLLGQKASLPRRTDGLSSRHPRLTGPARGVPQCRHVVCALRSVVLAWDVPADTLHRRVNASCAQVSSRQRVTCAPRPPPPCCKEHVPGIVRLRIEVFPGLFNT